MLRPAPVDTYARSDPPPLPAFYGALVTPAALSYLLMVFGLMIVISQVKDRLIDKTTHQLMVTPAANPPPRSPPTHPLRLLRQPNR